VQDGRKLYNINSLEMNQYKSD